MAPASFQAATPDSNACTRSGALWATIAPVTFCSSSTAGAAAVGAAGIVGAAAAAAAGTVGATAAAVAGTPVAAAATVGATAVAAAAEVGATAVAVALTLVAAGATCVGAFGGALVHAT